MTAKEQLQSIINNTYTTEDGDEYKVELNPGLSDEEIEQLALRLPTGKIPEEIRELLKFSSGFTFGPDEITFDAVGQFGFEEFFPASVQLCMDGLGNCWILDIDVRGNWGPVFYVCHDPAVIVKNSDGLAQFIEHIDEYGKLRSKSHLDIIHEKTVMDICFKTPGLIDHASAITSTDEALKSFASGFTPHFVFADLRNTPLGSGFTWGEFGPDIDNAKRHPTAFLWAIEKVKKKGFFSRLLGR